MRHQKQAITTLLGGAGVIVILMGIFMDGPDFEMAIVIAVSIWVLTGALGTFLDAEHDGTNFKPMKALITFLGGSGAIVIIMAIFLNTPSFGMALVIAVSIWILTGTLSVFFKESQPTSGYYTHHQPPRQEFTPKKPKVAPISKSMFCTNCGTELEVDSLYCTSCGQRLK